MKRVLAWFLIALTFVATCPTWAQSNCYLLSGGRLSCPSAKHIYVDGNRTDTYVATGSITAPFKTMGAAVSQVVTNGDNATYPYVIDVAPATYAETVDVGNSAIYSITFEGHGRAGTTRASQGSSPAAPFGATLSPASGNSFQALANNNQITSLQVVGFNFTNSVAVTNSTASNTMGMIAFVDCVFGGGVSAQGVKSLQILDSSLAVGQPFSMTNSDANWINSDMNSGAAAVIWNAGLPAPSGLSSSVLELVSWSFNPATFSISAGSLVVVQNLNVGAAGDTITVNGTLITVDAPQIFSNVTVNSGGTLQVYSPAGISGTLTLNSGGTYSPTGAVYTGQIFLGAGLCQILSGAGSPQSVVAAPVCSLYTRTDGGAGSTLYVKESGTGTTGWVAK